MKIEKLRKKYKNCERLDVDSVAFEENSVQEEYLLEYIHSVSVWNFKRQTLPVIILCAVILTVFSFSASLVVIDKNHTIARAKEKNETLEQRVSSLNKKVDNLSERVSTLNSELEESKSAENRIYTGQSVAGQQVVLQSGYYDVDNMTCAIPGCSNSPSQSSFYCFQHECLKVGCHEKKANDLCHYCIMHKCAVPNCNNGQSLDGIYCIRHSN